MKTTDLVEAISNEREACARTVELALRGAPPAILAGLDAGKARELLDYVASLIRARDERGGEGAAKGMGAAKPTSLDELRLGKRARNCLRAAEIRTVPHLLEWTPKMLLRIQHFGKTTLKDVQQALAEHGLYLAADEPVGGKQKEQAKG